MADADDATLWYDWLAIRFLISGGATSPGTRAHKDSNVPVSQMVADAISAVHRCQLLLQQPQHVPAHDPVNVLAREPGAFKSVDETRDVLWTLVALDERRHSVHVSADGQMFSSNEVCNVSTVRGEVV